MEIKMQIYETIIQKDMYGLATCRELQKTEVSYHLKHLTAIWAVADNYMRKQKYIIK